MNEYLLKGYFYDKIQVEQADFIWIVTDFALKKNFRTETSLKLDWVNYYFSFSALKAVTVSFETISQWEKAVKFEKIN